MRGEVTAETESTMRQKALRFDLIFIYSNKEFLENPAYAVPNAMMGSFSSGSFNYYREKGIYN